MNVPSWGVWMMLTASAVGVVLLVKELARRGWPGPL